MTQIKIGAQLHTVRDYCLTREGLFDALRRIREIGYDGVEIEDAHKVANPEEIAEFLEKIGLEVCCTRSRYGRTEFDLEGMIREAKLYGTPYMGVGTIGCEDIFYSASGIRRYTAFMTEVTEKAQEQGIIPTYDLRSQEYVRDGEGKLAYLRPSETLFPVERILSDTPKAFHMAPDSWHLVNASIPIPECLNALKGRVDIFRFRDVKITPNDLTFYRAHRDPCECGEGVLDFASWLPSLTDAGVKWITLGQEFCTKEPFACLEISLRNIRPLVDA